MSIWDINDEDRHEQNPLRANVLDLDEQSDLEAKAVSPAKVMQVKVHELGERLELPSREHGGR